MPEHGVAICECAKLGVYGRFIGFLQKHTGYKYFIYNQVVGNYVPGLYQEINIIKRKDVVYNLKKRIMVNAATGIEDLAFYTFKHNEVGGRCFAGFLALGKNTMKTLGKIVGISFGFVTKDKVSGGYLLKKFFAGSIAVVLIRVVLKGKDPVGRFDFGLGAARLHAQYFVIVFQDTFLQR